MTRIRFLIPTVALALLPTGTAAASSPPLWMKEHCPGYDQPSYFVRIAERARQMTEAVPNREAFVQWNDAVRLGPDILCVPETLHRRERDPDVAQYTAIADVDKMATLRDQIRWSVRAAARFVAYDDELSDRMAPVMYGLRFHELTAELAAPLRVLPDPRAWYREQVIPMHPFRLQERERFKVGAAVLIARESTDRLRSGATPYADLTAHWQHARDNYAVAGEAALKCDARVAETGIERAGVSLDFASARIDAFRGRPATDGVTWPKDVERERVGAWQDALAAYRDAYAAARAAFEASAGAAACDPTVDVAELTASSRELLGEAVEGWARMETLMAVDAEHYANGQTSIEGLPSRGLRDALAYAVGEPNDPYAPGRASDAYATSLALYRARTDFTAAGRGGNPQDFNTALMRIIANAETTPSTARRAVCAELRPDPFLSPLPEIDPDVVEPDALERADRDLGCSPPLVTAR